MNHIRYRPDIDGLRAIAILSVIGFHAFPNRIQGGFIGVDIFFVISGFLISIIIFNNLEKENFSYLEFYSRRIKRIFPALIIVLITSWIFGWYVLFSDEFAQLGKHIAGGVGFIANFILWNEAGYFDNISETKPLLHLWSLGIEEQFYIFWPMLLGLVWKKKLNFLVIVVFIALISFSANIYTLHYFSSISAFYLPINRFWELMIGGILAYIFLHKSNWLLLGKFYLNLQSILGCTLIITSVLCLNKDSVLFSGWALLPTLGAFFIISAQKSWINNYILSNRILVYIGLISYPLYLWHWSLLSFLHILGYGSREEKISVVILSFILAVLTYEFVESKIRKNNKITIIRILIILAFLLLFLGISTWQKVFSSRNNSDNIALIGKAISDWEYPNGLKSIDINNIRVFIKNGSKQKTLFYGDSHMEQYAPRIVKLIDEDTVNSNTAIFATVGGCPPIPNVYEDQHPLCSADFREAIIQYALSSDVDSVVIAAYWSYLIKNKKPLAGEYRYYYLQDNKKIYFDENGIDYALKSLEDTLSTISKYKKVFLIIDNPTGNYFDPMMFITGSRLTNFVLNDKTKNFQEYDKKQAILRTLMIAMAERSNAIVIDAPSYFCKDNQCQTTLNDGVTPIYKDSGHIRSFYVKQFIEYLDITVKK